MKQTHMCTPHFVYLALRKKTSDRCSLFKCSDMNFQLNFVHIASTRRKMSICNNNHECIIEREYFNNRIAYSTSFTTKFGIPVVKIIK